jgi:hypothetical protein
MRSKHGGQEQEKNVATARLESYEHVVRGAVEQKYGPVRPPVTQYADEQLIKMFARPQLGALVAPIRSQN